MKSSKKSVLALAIFMSTGVSWGAWEDCTFRGDVVADGGTRVIARSQAQNVWHDWVWRGKWDRYRDQNIVQYCYPHPGSRGCAYTWGGSKTASYSYTVGWSVGGGFDIPIWKIGGNISGQYERQKTWTTSQTESFDMRTDYAPGHFAQPVIVAVRRWKTGHFNGGHFASTFSPGHYRTGPNKGCFLYDWAWRNFGSWSGSEREGGYKMIHIARTWEEL